MKKLLLLICGIVAGLGTIVAQSVQYEAIAGINVASMSHMDSKVGVHVGIKGTKMLSQETTGAYVNAALLLTQKGAQIDYGNLLEAQFTAFYFEVPIHVGFKYTVNEKVALFGDFGPYVAFGAFGKSKLAVSSATIKCDTFGDTAGVKRFDAGLGFKVGVELEKRIPVSIGYDFGLLNIDDESEEESVKNTNFTVSIGYKF